MRIIEKGFDVEGVECWFVLEDADLKGIYYSLEEAEQNL
jgi:hypothetical protein